MSNHISVGSRVRVRSTASPFHSWVGEIVSEYVESDKRFCWVVLDPFWPTLDAPLSFAESDLTFLEAVPFI